MEVTFKPGSNLIFDTVQHEYERLCAIFADAKYSCLHIDLGSVKQCDSAGLALLIEATRMGKQYKIPISVKGLPEKVYALAKFCGVEEVLEVGTTNA